MAFKSDKQRKAVMAKINSNYASNIDMIQAREMELQIMNDADVYRQRLEPMEKNLARKKKKGIYDHNLAVKGYLNIVDDWERQHRADVGKATPETRIEVAKRLTEYFEGEYNLGNYG